MNDIDQPWLTEAAGVHRLAGARRRNIAAAAAIFAVLDGYAQNGAEMILAIDTCPFRSESRSPGQMGCPSNRCQPHGTEDS
jgi:hypothetical protein